MPNVEPAIQHLVKKNVLRPISRNENSHRYAIDTRGLNERTDRAMRIIRYELQIRDQPDEGECRYEIIDINEFRAGDTILCTDRIEDVVQWINEYSIDPGIGKGGSERGS